MEYYIVVWTIFNKAANAIMTNADVIDNELINDYVHIIHSNDTCNITNIYRLDDGVDLKTKFIN